MSLKDFYRVCKASIDDIIAYAKINRFFVSVALFAVLACGTVFGALYFHFFESVNIPMLAITNYESASYWGQLGDFAGGFLNPLLSFLALMAVLKTMSLQRAEMKAAQQEAKIATQEQRQQTAVYSRQMFESTLFGMLDVHSKILADIKYTGSTNDIVEGRHAIEEIVKNFKETNDYRAGVFSPKLVNDEEIQSQIKKFCTQWKSSTGHYFRNLYWIMKMIDSSQDTSIDSKDLDVLALNKRRRYTDYLRKRSYTNIIRAQLSDSEMALLQINCLGPYGADLKYYAEKYSLLKPLGEKHFGGWAQYMSSQFNGIAFLGLEHIDADEIIKMTAHKVMLNTSAIRNNS